MVVKKRMKVIFRRANWTKNNSKSSTNMITLLVIKQWDKQMW